MGFCHTGDLKNALTIALNRILQPVRDHFEQNAEAAALLKKVKVCSGLLWLNCSLHHSVLRDPHGSEVLTISHALLHLTGILDNTVDHKLCLLCSPTK